HLNRKQVANMSEREVNSIGMGLIDAACKRDRNVSYFMMCVEDLRGLANVFSIGQPYKSDVFEQYHELYRGKTLKTHQDFINYCFEKYPNGGEVKFQEYYDFMNHPYYDNAYS